MRRVGGDWTASAVGSVQWRCCLSEDHSALVLFPLECLVLPSVFSLFTSCPSFLAFNDSLNESHLCPAASPPLPYPLWLLPQRRPLSPLRQMVLCVPPGPHPVPSPAGSSVFWPLTFGFATLCLLSGHLWLKLAPNPVSGFEVWASFEELNPLFASCCVMCAVGHAYLAATVTKDQTPLDCIWWIEETLSICIVSFFGASIRGLNVFVQSGAGS